MRAQVDILAELEHNLVLSPLRRIEALTFEGEELRSLHVLNTASGLRRVVPWMRVPAVLVETARPDLIQRDGSTRTIISATDARSTRCPMRIGHTVTIRADRKLLRIYAEGTFVKTHARQPPGGHATDHRDYPKR
jgi:hypothetical protein